MAENVDWERLHDAMLGLAVGNALGIPFEGSHRDGPRCDGMVGSERYGLPAGTYGAATAMSLATVDSLRRNRWVLDVDDLRARLQGWLRTGVYATVRKPFDVGEVTRRALESGRPVGGEWTNGNGALTRMLPLAFLPGVTEGMVEAAAGVTHANRTAQSACVDYVRYAMALLKGASPLEAAAVTGLTETTGLSRDMVRSDGYAVTSLQASVWCLASSDSFEDCVRAAVGLGGDTGDIAGLAAGLAVLRYGLAGVPSVWLDGLRGRGVVAAVVAPYGPSPSDGVEAVEGEEA